MVVFQENLPQLEIVEVAGNAIDPDSQGPVTVQLPFNAPAAQSVVIRASNFNGVARVKVVLTPAHGEQLEYDLDIPNSDEPATGEITVQFPANQLTEVNAWTR